MYPLTSLKTDMSVIMFSLNVPSQLANPPKNVFFLLRLAVALAARALTGGFHCSSQHTRTPPLYASSTSPALPPPPPPPLLRSI